MKPEVIKYELYATDELGEGTDLLGFLIEIASKNNLLRGEMRCGSDINGNCKRCCLTVRKK